MAGFEPGSFVHVKQMPTAPRRARANVAERQKNHFFCVCKPPSTAGASYHLETVGQSLGFLLVSTTMSSIFPRIVTLLRHLMSPNQGLAMIKILAIVLLF
jgi:hypothetical protein